MADKLPGVRCVECGARLDAGERCDCERRAEREPVKPKRTKQYASQRKAFDQYLDERQREWLYS